MGQSRKIRLLSPHNHRFMATQRCPLTRQAATIGRIRFNLPASVSSPLSHPAFFQIVRRTGPHTLFQRQIELTNEFPTSGLGQFTQRSVHSRIFNPHQFIGDPKQSSVLETRGLVFVHNRLDIGKPFVAFLSVRITGSRPHGPNHNGGGEKPIHKLGTNGFSVEFVMLTAHFFVNFVRMFSTTAHGNAGEGIVIRNGRIVVAFHQLQHIQ
mmetsp:Transcript_4452/g.4213  ORF Transcript_4452/g.4213 Transcript_4452/m.4213 type:complete len:210 (+) Transcript_4452:845-1474(+)